MRHVLEKKTFPFIMTLEGIDKEGGGGTTLTVSQAQKIILEIG